MNRLFNQTATKHPTNITETCTPFTSTDKLHTNRNSFYVITQDTTHEHSNPQTSHTRHRQR